MAESCSVAAARKQKWRRLPCQAACSQIQLGSQRCRVLRLSRSVQHWQCRSVEMDDEGEDDVSRSKGSKPEWSWWEKLLGGFWGERWSRLCGWVLSSEVAMRIGFELRWARARKDLGRKAQKTRPRLPATNTEGGLTPNRIWIDQRANHSRSLFVQWYKQRNFGLSACPLHAALRSGNDRNTARQVCHVLVPAMCDNGWPQQSYETLRFQTINLLC